MLCSTDKKFRALFQKAGMKIKKTELQNGLPKDLYPVRSYALQPESIS
jgi:protein N-terminal methyltransferase